ncbi:hypothetical protein AB0G15_40880 [Streptosporangium sp. NPDC023825]|uniref:hypothetical protein n=1 Tax=Streptosporangium sp. NPDC023825 TaxID=3154909 RepID=UPI00342826A0
MRRLALVYSDPVGSGDGDLLSEGGYSMSRYGCFAEAVLDDADALTGYFLGHSHGGFVALQLLPDDERSTWPLRMGSHATPQRRSRSPDRRP